MTDEEADTFGDFTFDRDQTAAAWVGMVLDERYRVTDVLGAGAFGIVFRAKHLVLGRDVAVKVLLPESPSSDATVHARFRREADLLARLTHPGIVAATDYGVFEGRPYLVMELIEGRSLRDLLDDEGPIPLDRALAITRPLLRALAYAHGKDVLHRDLKPGNVIVSWPSEDDEPIVKVLDFGLAKLVRADGSGSTPLTVRGTAFGTPGYVSPEVLAAKPAGPRADLYAVGVMLFEMLTGRRPFAAETRMQELRNTLTVPPPLLSSVAPALAHAAEVDSILQLALAREPEARFSDAAAMLAAIEPIGRALPRTPLSPKARPAPARGSLRDARVPLPVVVVLVAIPSALAIVFAITTLFLLIAD